MDGRAASVGRPDPIANDHTQALSREAAAELDARDPLRGFRERFVIDPEVVYLDGNSLGCLPRATVPRLENIVAQWGARGIRGWDEGWLELPLEIGDRLGSAVLGAAPGQTVIGDSTTVCFYKLASAALDARPGRGQILTDVDNFPTDRYVLEGLAAARGLELVWLEGDRAGGPDPASVASLVGPQTALVTFSHVSYRSAHVADMAAISRIVEDAGALMLWDLSHSAGSVKLSLDGDHAGLAVGCTYKYLNAGPGAPAYMYVRRDLQSELRQPIWGWLGRRDPFEMAPGYEVVRGMQGFLSGTPPILSLVAVDEGVRLVAEAGIEEIRAKGVELTEFAVALADAVLAPRGVSVASPREAARRGAHVALAHPNARELCARLVADGVIPDFRRPDVIRFGLSPLTTRFVDVWDGVEALRRFV
ncbi:MAG TPA: aminotransferase class V-fold PLP-dependent enzyme [Solirubrobacteraceae bacterium]|nr:aminotransferase class V-fold PLP-dependent enzyme [Solirubrobacteraceae bacterium]